MTETAGGKIGTQDTRYGLVDCSISVRAITTVSLFVANTCVQSMYVCMRAGLQPEFHSPVHLAGRDNLSVVGRQRHIRHDAPMVTGVRRPRAADAA